MADRTDKVEDRRKPFYIKAFDYLAYLLFLFFEKIWLVLPRNIARKSGMALGWLWYQIDWKHYTVAMRNLRMAFSAEKTPCEIKDICRKSFMHWGEVFIDLIRATEMTKENKDEFFIYESAVDVESLIKEMIDTNKGVVAISAHLGNQEMLIGYVLKWGIGRENIITKRIKNPHLNRYIQSQREKLGVHVIPHRKSAKEIIKRMQSGEITVFLLDQRASYHEGVRVNFFGEPVVAHKAVAQLALFFELKVFPIFVIKNGDGRYRLILQDELKLPKTGDLAVDTKNATQLFQDVIEKMVREYPEQWLWQHNRWKYGAEAPYDL